MKRSKVKKVAAPIWERNRKEAELVIVDLAQKVEPAENTGFQNLIKINNALWMGWATDKDGDKELWRGTEEFLNTPIRAMRDCVFNGAPLPEIFTHFNPTPLQQACYDTRKERAKS